uniref:Uncharacterized protein n=1 Tax=Cannabis sativa TaxID=3483 RepID=A0A803QXG9_CANSA
MTMQLWSCAMPIEPCKKHFPTNYLMLLVMNHSQTLPQVLRLNPIHQKCHIQFVLYLIQMTCIKMHWDSLQPTCLH